MPKAPRTNRHRPILSDMDAEIEALEQKLNKYRQIKQGDDAGTLDRKNEVGMKENISSNPGLVNEIRNLIEQARSQVAATVWRLVKTT